MEIDLLPGGGERRAEVRRYLADHAGPPGLSGPGLSDPGLSGPGLSGAGLDEVLATPPGYDVGLWAGMAERGWLAAAPMGDLVVVLEELGRARVPTPVQNGVVQSAAALSAIQPPDLAPRLDELAAGRWRYALCLSGPSGSFEPEDLGVTWRLDGGGYRLDGLTRFVPYADSADVLLVAAAGPDDDGHSLVEVSPRAAGVSIAVSSSMAGDRQAEIGLEHVSVGRAAVLGQPGRARLALERAVVVGSVGLAAEMVGASAALIEHTVAHVTTRHQFGASLGSLPTVQHRLADMVLDHVAALGAVEEAVRALDGGEAGVLESAAAKALCSLACRRVAVSAHQLWGGTGYLADAGIHHWSRLIKGAETMLGAPARHRRVVVDTLRAGGGWSPGHDR